MSDSTPILKYMMKQLDDFYSGIFFLIIGSFFLLFGIDLDVGTISAIGPGFVPIMTSVVLIVISLFLIVRSWVP